ncbi:MAG: hypothetical protein Q8N70_08005, partial [Deltaproteobacteria bacterium]|nr:hypothetical protein [Deltaproteobacteria bacterium]
RASTSLSSLSRRLSEPFTLREPQGERFFPECPEQSRRKGSCFDKLSRTEKANDFKINSVHPEPVKDLVRRAG